MGTRALISIDGKLLFATHWDGYPSSLGKDLLECDKSIESILRVAKNHEINFAERSLMKSLDDEDYKIIDIINYGDWADYQYDIRGKDIYFIELDGRYPDSKRHLSDFELLTFEECKRRKNGSNSASFI